jgi:acetyl-CoA carboxylase carboxyl transferase subunit beta
MPNDTRKKRETPDGLWMKCDGCQATVYRKAVEERMRVCPECDYHFTLGARERLDMILDQDSFEEFFPNMSPTDPFEFADLETYRSRLERYQKATGLPDAIIVGKGKILDHELLIGFMEPNFMRASMGSVVGEKVTRLFEKAIEMRLPVIIFCASGGARMQEGALSLMQMAKTSAAVARLDEAGGLYISVLTNPTTAGVMASFASLGDLVVAEPKALIGFTGPRVIKETLKTELPEGFQTSEFMLEHGFVDRVIHRTRLKEELALLLDYFALNKK